MRPLLILALLAPATALANAPLCPPVTFDGQPSPSRSAGPVQLAQAPRAAPPPPAALPAPVAPLAPELAGLPFVRHVAASGATVRDLGEVNGMRSVAALSGDEFMLFQVAPGGEVAVSGAVASLSPQQLAEMAPGGVTELGTLHGLRGLFVRSGPHFQVFYVAADGRAVIPGLLYDARGRELTRSQVAAVPGAVPTVVVGDGAAAAPPAAGQPAMAQPAALALVERAHAGMVGREDAPTLWMLSDPRCGYSVRAMQMLQPFIASGRVRVAVVPVAVLDREPNGASAREAGAMLSQPAEAMVAAWQNRALGGAITAEAASRFRDNMVVANAIALRGTPTFVWRRADGSEGRVDGLPEDVPAMLASMAPPSLGR